MLVGKTREKKRNPGGRQIPAFQTHTPHISRFPTDMRLMSASREITGDELFDN